MISQVIAKDAAPAEAHALVEAVKEIEEVQKEEKKDDSKKGDKKIRMERRTIRSTEVRSSLQSPVFSLPELPLR